jgi:hypothetical protein
MAAINSMTALRHLGELPAFVHLGASLNIVVTIFLTWYVFQLFGGGVVGLIPWAVAMPLINIIPVVILRRVDRSDRPFPETSQMNFLRDQHRFSSWVYAVAAANMFFWIVFSWWCFSIYPFSITLNLVQVSAFAITYVPLWRRLHPSFNRS